MNEWTACWPLDSLQQVGTTLNAWVWRRVRRATKCALCTWTTGAIPGTVVPSYTATSAQSVLATAYTPPTKSLETNMKWLVVAAGITSKRKTGTTSKAKSCSFPMLKQWILDVIPETLLDVIRPAMLVDIFIYQQFILLELSKLFFL